MKTGYQYNYTHQVQWIPSDKNSPLIRGGVAKGGVRTGKGNWFGGYNSKSFYCEQCHVIITPVSNIGK